MPCMDGSMARLDFPSGLTVAALLHELELALSEHKDQCGIDWTESYLCVSFMLPTTEEMAQEVHPI